MSNDIEKRLKKLEKMKKPLKKFKPGSEYVVDTKLDPYDRKKVSIRDIDDLIEEEVDENESEENS